MILLEWKTEKRKVNDLIPYESNPRRLTKDQYEQLRKSLEKFNLAEIPAINTDNKILAGHQRIKVLQKLGRGEEVIDVRVPNKTLTEEQAKEYLIRSNKNAGEWDWDILANLFDDADLIEWGFTEQELTGNFEGLSPEETAGDDNIPEKVEPRSVVGDIYDLGQHRLICGDSADLSAMDKVLDGQKCDLVFTDPPYGVSIGDKNKVLNSVRNAVRCLENIENDCLSPEKLKVILLEVFKNVYVSANDNCAIYVCSPQGGELGRMMMMMMMEAGLEVRHILIWVKNSPTFSIGRLDYDYQHEPILFTWKKTHKKIMKGEHKTSCWFIDKPRESKLHPTMKPVSIPENAMLNSSEENDIILDPFGGAGSTLIACERTNRQCRMIELAPKYCDVIVQRYVDFCKQNNLPWSVKLNDKDITFEYGNQRNDK